MRFNNYITEEKEKIKILVLTTHKEEGSDEDVYKTVGRIKEECNKRNQECHVIFAEDSYIERDKSNIPKVYSVDSKEGVELNKENTVCFVRGSVSKQKACIDLVSQIERHEIFCINHRETIEECSDKFRTIIKLADADIPVPKTSLVTNENGIKIAFEKVGENFPVVLKTITGSKGIGVFTANDWPSLKSTLQTIWKIDEETEILIQEYIDAKFDIRVHVLGNEVIAAMKRYKIKEDFRSNYSLGGKIEKIKLTAEQEELAIRAAKVVNAVWSGVDMMVGPDGPLIIEINSSPGTEGIEKATGENIVEKVLDYVEDKDVWTKKTIECGFIEKLKIKGIGELDAKLDTGSGTYCVIHADSWTIDDDEVTWTHHGHEHTNKLEFTKEVGIGGLKNESEERPVIRLDVEFYGTIYKGILFALSNRAGLTDLLLNRRFIKKANLVVNPSKKYMLATTVIEEQDTQTVKRTTTQQKQTTGAPKPKPGGKQLVKTKPPIKSVNQPPKKTQSPKEQAIEKLRAQGWTYTGSHSIWKKDNKQVKVEEDGKLIPIKNGEGEKKEGEKGAKKETEKKGVAGEKPEEEIKTPLELSDTEQTFTEEEEKEANEMINHVIKNMDKIFHHGEPKEGSLEYAANIEMTKHVIKAVKGGERNLDNLAATAHKGYQTAIKNYYKEKDEKVKKDEYKKNTKDFMESIDNDPRKLYDDKGKIKPGVEKKLMAQADFNYDIKDHMKDDLKSIKPTDYKRIEIKGKISDNKENIVKNLKGEFDRYKHYLAKDTNSFVENYTKHFSDMLNSDDLKDMDAKKVDEFLHDAVNKLMYQEVESNRQAFTDHGIRHIVGNITRSDELLKAFKSDITGKERLMASFSILNHDIGYTAPVVRDGGPTAGIVSGFHKQFSAKYIEQQRNTFDADKPGNIFNSAEYDKIHSDILHHDNSYLNFKKDPVGVAVRLADNTSLFNKEKLPSSFKYIKNGPDLLLKMGDISKKYKEAEKNQDLGTYMKCMADFEAHRGKMYESIDKSNLDEKLKRDLKAGVSNINYLTPKWSAGALAGETENIEKDEKTGMITINIKHDPDEEKISKIIDIGGDKFKKMLEDYKIDTSKMDNLNEILLGDGIRIKVNNLKKK